MSFAHRFDVISGLAGHPTILHLKPLAAVSLLRAVLSKFQLAGKVSSGEDVDQISSEVKTRNLVDTIERMSKS